MAARSLTPTFTHRVLNQSSLYRGNLYAADTALKTALEANCLKVSSQNTARLNAYGNWSGSSTTAEAAREANENRPVLKQYDRNGRRVDVVNFSSSWHYIYSHAVENEIPSLAWKKDGSHAIRGALSSLHYQAESGTSCPLTMTNAVIPALREADSLLQSGQKNPYEEHIRKALAPHYDPRNVPISEKAGVVAGMSMTELTGGSDVRSNTTMATPLNPNLAQVSAEEVPQGEAFALRGHKWFTSAPQSDFFLTLSYAEGVKGIKDSAGPTCFVVPRWKNDGTRNSGFRIMRLKDKLGDRSNASSEVQYDNAHGYLLGPIGRGVPTILKMVEATRLDCALGSAGLMRLMVRHAVWYTSQRKAFGSILSSAPAMTAVLADLSVESEAAMALSVMLAQVFDDCQRGTDETAKKAGFGSLKNAQAFKRLAVAVGKYYICKRAPAVAYEALESIGGNGYVSDFEMERHFRQAPLNAIWEGSGNVIALDILRTCAKEPVALETLLRRCATTAHVHPALKAHLTALHTTITKMATSGDASMAASLQDPLHARFLVEHLGLALLGHALAFNVQAFSSDASGSSGSGNADERTRDVLEVWCRKNLPGYGSGAATASSSLHLPTAFYGTVPLPGTSTAGALNSKELNAQVQRIVEQELAALRAAAHPPEMDERAEMK
jgi:putative acyl-CoA dehydrogenase